MQSISKPRQGHSAHAYPASDTCGFAVCFLSTFHFIDCSLSLSLLYHPATRTQTKSAKPWKILSMRDPLVQNFAHVANHR